MRYKLVTLFKQTLEIYSVIQCSRLIYGYSGKYTCLVDEEIKQSMFLSNWVTGAKEGVDYSSNPSNFLGNTMGIDFYLAQALDSLHNTKGIFLNENYCPIFLY